MLKKNNNNNNKVITDPQIRNDAETLSHTKGNSFNVVISYLFAKIS